MIRRYTNAYGDDVFVTRSGMEYDPFYEPEDDDELRSEQEVETEPHRRS